VLNINYYKGTNMGFTSLEIQITYDNSGQFFGLKAESIVFGVRNGANIVNYRGGPII
jgi:hypothetical protein